ncbi:IS630 family transposase [Kistimonas asteriae]|uniref:IS630 family transposase n=1 Tax=Kistimonas asteriae TaxID=517724 RepID=UPI001BA5F788|nr:IS630 family transposase [Kistimonas asteriae]
MSKVDGRKISHAVRESIRMEAMQQWQDGASASHLAEQYGVNKSCIYEWINSYKQGGFDALKTCEMPGRPPKLTDSQKSELAEILLHQPPTAYGFYKALWTRDIVAAIIKRVFDASMYPASVGRMLRKMGFSPQRPTRKAWQQSKKVHEWLNETYPALRTQAEEHNALIYFADEASVRSDYHSGTTLGRKGCTPLVEATGARFGINMISAISGEGTMRYMTITGRFNADVLFAF